MRITRAVLAGLGVVLSAGLRVGLAVDIAAFDRTRRGREAPYQGWTAPPIDWSAVDVTPTGMARRGHVVNTLIDCASGTISIQAGGQVFPFRVFSGWALAVHKPREACIGRGFSPGF